MWTTVRLGDVCKIVNGSTPSRKNSAYWDGGTIAWFTIDDMRVQGRDIRWTQQHVTDLATADTSLKVLPPNTVLLCCTASVGEAAIARIELATNQQFNGLIPTTDKLLPEYLYYVATTLKSKLLAVSGSVTINFVAISKLKEIEVPLPPLAEQQRIVAKLDAAFAEIDRAIEIETERTRQIDSFYECALNELHDNDGSAVKLADVCDIEASLIDPKEPLYQQKKHVGAGNIVALSNDLIDVQTAEEEGLISGKYPFDATTILYSKIRPYLRKVHMPNFEGICSADMYPLTPKSGKLDREYLYYLLLSQHFTDYAMAGSARSGMPKVNRKHLFNYEFKLPPLERQIELAERVTAVLQHVAEYRKATLNKQQQFEKLRAAALAQELRSEAA